MNCEWQGHRLPFSPGMTLRDYFAGQALQGLLSNSAIVQLHVIRTDEVAHYAYEFADAMLNRRDAS
jgi:hypothetical protein